MRVGELFILIYYGIFLVRLFMLVNSYLKIFTSCYTEFPLCSGQEVLREEAVNDEGGGGEKDEDEDGEDKDEGGL